MGFYFIYTSNCLWNCFMYDDDFNMECIYNINKRVSNTLLKFWFYNKCWGGYKK